VGYKTRLKPGRGFFILIEVRYIIHNKIEIRIPDGRLCILFAASGYVKMVKGLSPDWNVLLNFTDRRLLVPWESWVVVRRFLYTRSVAVITQKWIQLISLLCVTGLSGCGLMDFFNKNKQDAKDLQKSARERSVDIRVSHFRAG
jgi:hypothetical protein